MSRKVESVYEGVILEVEFKLGKRGSENLMDRQYKSGKTNDLDILGEPKHCWS